MSEGSIGSNLRRIEAMTGDGAFEYIEFEEQLLRRAGDLLRAAPKEVPDKIERLSEQVRGLQDELTKLKTKETAGAAADLARQAENGVLVARRDGLGNNELRQLAIETVRALSSGVVGLVGAADGRAFVAVAVSKDLVGAGHRPTQSRARPQRCWVAGSAKAPKSSRGRQERRSGRRGPRCRAGAGRRVETVTTGRALGVDLGSRRIGLAVSDPTRTVASPHDVVVRSGDLVADRQTIVGVARELGATTIVVGLPISLSGHIGPAARSLLAEVDALRELAADAGIEVVVHDERLTSVTAERAVDEARRRATTGAGRRQGRGVDHAAGVAGALVMTRGRRTAIVIIALVVVPLVVLGRGALWFWYQVSGCNGGANTVNVQIVKGWSVPRIGDELHKRGLVGNSLVFSVYSRLNGDTSFEAGTYQMRKHMCVRDAVHILKAPPHIVYTRFTIPPGFWLKQIAARVQKLPGRNGSVFLDAAENNSVRSAYEPDGVNNLEGLLFPDTYDIAAEEDEIGILQTMATQFDKTANALGLATANVQGHSAYDIIKIASLIESEAKTEKDRPLIASVIYNRLAQHMMLQIDSTLIYARGNPKNRTLSDADKAINSPYNTYRIFGLPPTPIDSPSAASIKAALAPAQTPYLYYVVIDKQGDSAFAVNARGAAGEHCPGQGGRGSPVTSGGIRISGETRVVGVIGDPVRHSLSPVLHNAAYRRSASTGSTSRSRSPTAVSATRSPRCAPSDSRG